MPRMKVLQFFKSLLSGLKINAIPYIGNMKREELPFNVLSWCIREPSPVQNTSMHQPVEPHRRKSFNIVIRNLAFT